MKRLLLFRLAHNTGIKKIQLEKKFSKLWGSVLWPFVSAAKQLSHDFITDRNSREPNVGQWLVEI